MAKAASDKREQALYFPEIMLAEIQQAAVRLDRSLSYIVQVAWKHAYAHIHESGYETLGELTRKGGGGDKRKQTLYFPEAMLEEIQDEAVRIDSSLSFVVQAAYVHAREAIAALPTVREP